MPESPRYLVSKDKHDQATRTLAMLHGKPQDDPAVMQEHQDILDAVTYERTLGQPTWFEMFTTYRRRSFIAIAVQALGQLSGINIVTYYAPKMYEAVLGPGNITILFAGFTALVYFFGAIGATFLVDRAGRRPLFMTGSILLTIWLVIMAIFNKVYLGLTSAILVITFTMIYVGTFGATWACVDWLCRFHSFTQPAEFKKTNHLSTDRSRGNLPSAHPRQRHGIGRLLQLALQLCRWSLDSPDA